MADGGISRSQSAERILRWITLLTPIFIALYLFLGSRHVFGMSFDRSVPQSLTDTFIWIWLLSGLAMSAIYNNTDLNRALRMLFFHVLGSIFIVAYIGASFPLVVLWIILILASYTYFGLFGASISIVTIGATAAVDSILHPEVMTASVAMASSIALLSAALVGFFRVQERDEVEFETAISDERLQRDSILTLINNLADAVISTDKNGQIKIYNAAALSLLDTNENLAKKHIDDIIVMYDQDDKPVRFIDMLHKAHSLTIIDTLNMVIGEENVRLELTYSPIHNSYNQKGREAEGGYIIILRDITKAKSLEEERDEFISVVSHELRTPIAIAEGTISNTQVLFERDNIHDDLLRESLETAHDQVIFLAKMVNDLSTLSRAERGVADEPEEIDIRQLVDSLFNEYAGEAKAKGLRLDLDIAGKLGTVMASRLYLHELIQNFITNAIKYTKEGSITFKVVQKNDKVTFTVTDTGIGISKADQAKVFQKFYRSEDYRTRETGGTGLGLYVAMKLAKKLDTKIELTSRLNHGSSFSFTLPTAK